MLNRGSAIHDDTPAEALHALRLQCKKLRYLLDLFAGLYDPDAIAGLLRYLKKLQDNLGDFNDCEVQQDTLQSFATEMAKAGATPVETFLAMGRLEDPLHHRTVTDDLRGAPEAAHLLLQLRILSPEADQLQGLIDGQLEVAVGLETVHEAVLESLNKRMTLQDYETAVRRIRDYIAAGDVYQVNLSQRFETRFQGSTFGFFRTLYQKNPAPFFAFMNAGDHHLVSTSPERFLRLDDHHVETRPIKGTRPRGTDRERDRALARELQRKGALDGEEAERILRSHGCRPGSLAA